MRSFQGQKYKPSLFKVDFPSTCVQEPYSAANQFHGWELLIAVTLKIMTNVLKISLTFTTGFFKPVLKYFETKFEQYSTRVVFSVNF